MGGGGYIYIIYIDIFDEQCMLHYKQAALGHMIHGMSLINYSIYIHALFQAVMPFKYVAGRCPFSNRICIRYRSASCPLYLSHDCAYGFFNWVVCSERSLKSAHQLRTRSYLQISSMC